MTQLEPFANRSFPGTDRPDMPTRRDGVAHALTPHGAGPTVVDIYYSDPIRRAVAHRLGISGRRHARHRNDRAGRPDRPGPHAILLFFRPPGASTAKVIIASRMFLDGSDVTDLPDVLTTLTQRARDYGPLALGPLVGNLCDRVEPLHAISRYLGVGVSSIDVAREGVDSLPWDGLAHLVDGTRMSMNGNRSEIPPHVVSTHTLDDHIPRFLNRTWQWAATTTPAPETRPDLAAAHSPLANLNEYLRSCEER